MLEWDELQSPFPTNFDIYLYHYHLIISIPGPNLPFLLPPRFKACLLLLFFPREQGDYSQSIYFSNRSEFSCNSSEHNICNTTPKGKVFCFHLSLLQPGLIPLQRELIPSPKSVNRWGTTKMRERRRGGRGESVCWAYPDHLNCKRKLQDCTQFALKNNKGYLSFGICEDEQKVGVFFHSKCLPGKDEGLLVSPQCLATPVPSLLSHILENCCFWLFRAFSRPKQLPTIHRSGVEDSFIYGNQVT